PISAQKSGKKIDINRYFIRLDINFKQIYDFSTEVTNTEIQKGFLEYYVMNLIAMKSWPSSSDKIPPIADFNFDIGDRKIWTRTDVQSKLESNVLSEIDQIQFAESSNLIMRRMWKENDDGEWEYDPIGQGIWEESLFALNNTRPFNGLSVGFTYIDWWPIYLNINDQEVLMPKSMQGTNIISFFGFNQYSFWYDVSFPVMVTVHDSNAFDGKGYDFRFAIEGNIRDNNRTTPSYTSLSESSGKKFACNMNQRNSGNIKIETVDAITGKPVTGRVDFMLGDESCFIGFIELDENNHSVISAPFPIGLGSIKINNEDYLIHEEKYFTSLEQGDEMTIEMIPFKEINASIFLKSLNFNPPTNEYLLPGADIVTPVNPIKEKATLVFERVADDVISEYTAFMTVNSSTERNIIKLVPGEYNVRGFLFYTDNNNPITIPEKTLNYEVFWGDDVEITLNSTEMNPYPRGGLVFDNETGYMEITANELYGNEKVNFYMLAFPPAQVHSAALVKGKPGLEQLSEWDTYSMIYRERLLPTWFI
ncbi:hypothetical protein HQ545_00295, partial [Candidatus Woesearchaeota archaeon]|nr:hypothetical protein [Candidatus Woesearchaeota archaeon]